MATSARGAVWTALLLSSLAATSGCSTEGVPASTPSSSCLPSTQGDAQIDWVPFLVVDGQMYATSYSDPEVALDDSEVGDVIATVSCRIADVGDPDFQPRDGDAAYLPAGTPLHQVHGRAPEEALTALEDGVWRLYRPVDE